MTQPPHAAGVHGAVDLSALSLPPGGGGTGSGAPARADDTDPTFGGVLKVVDTAGFGDAVNASLRVPAILVLHSGANPKTAEAVTAVARVARTFDGRVQVLSADVDADPQVAAALQVQAVPTAFGLLQGQPMPLFQGVPAEAQLRAVIEEVLKVAVQIGVTGRITLAEGPGETPTSPFLDEAFEAVEAGDYDAATTAYERALADNPKDEEARLGLAQVGLLRRTAGIDPQAARAEAAARPDDVAAATVVADIDLLGGHVDDAFGRLLDLVRTTTGEDRERAKAHLVELLAVVGSHDERVKKARTALMTALF